MAGTSATVERFVTDLPAQVWTTDTDLRITYTHESSSQALGLNEGDVVVTAPSDRLLEGMRVRAEQSQTAGARVADSKPKAP